MKDNIQTEKISENMVKEILSAINQVKHGEVTIIVQDSKVIQINKIEKRRFA
ncbi:MAG: YezD family protein [Nitrospirota bacterium]